MDTLKQVQQLRNRIKELEEDNKKIGELSYDNGFQDALSEEQNRCFNKIKELENEVESLKCCGNCGLVRKRHCGTLYCSYQQFDAEADEVCGSWTKKESK